MIDLNKIDNILFRAFWIRFTVPVAVLLVHSLSVNLLAHAYVVGGGITFDTTIKSPYLYSCILTGIFFAFYEHRKFVLEGSITENRLSKKLIDMCQPDIANRVSELVLTGNTKEAIKVIQGFDTVYHQQDNENSVPKYKP